MTRRRAVVAGLALGTAAGLLVLAALLLLEGRAPAGPAALPEPPAPGAPAPLAPGAEEEPGSAFRMVGVRIYQRSAAPPLTIVPAGARIVWIDSAIDRARQIVDLVLAGVAAPGAVPPAPPGLRDRDVYIDDRGVAWVDLEGGDALARIAGSDMEQALIACLARSLVENLAEVERVGIVIDGRPRPTLAGHVDLSRTFTGREWPEAGSGALDGGAAP